MGYAYFAPKDAFQLIIPDTWEHIASSSSIAFFHPDGVGSLNLSSMRSPRGVVPEPSAVILNFVPKQGLESQQLRIESVPCSIPAVKAAYTDYVRGDDAWRLWVFASPVTVVVASYNCRLSSKGKEDAIIDNIISSLRF